MWTFRSVGFCSSTLIASEIAGAFFSNEASSSRACLE